MLFNVPDVNGPDLLLEMSLKWHLFALARGSTLRRRHAVEFAIEGKQPSAGRLGEMDTDLLKSSTHAIGTQFRAFHHQLAHFIDFSDTRFAGGGTWGIIESCMAELRPPFEHLVHAMSRRAEVRTDGRM